MVRARARLHNAQSNCFVLCMGNDLGGWVNKFNDNLELMLAIMRHITRVCRET